MHALLTNREHARFRAHRLRSQPSPNPTLHSAPLASLSIDAIFFRSIPRIRFIFLLWI